MKEQMLKVEVSVNETVVVMVPQTKNMNIDKVITQALKDISTSVRDASAKGIKYNITTAEEDVDVEGKEDAKLEVAVEPDPEVVVEAEAIAEEVEAVESVIAPAVENTFVAEPTPTPETFVVEATHSSEADPFATNISPDYFTQQAQ